MNKNNNVFGASLLIAISSAAFAEPAPVNIAGINVTPSLTLEEKYDSNIFSSESNEKSSSITIVSPLVEAGVQNGTNTYAVKTGLQAGFYADSSDDNYLNAQIQADVHHEFTRKNAVDLSAQYALAHEPRGSGFSQGNATAQAEPDRYHTALVNGSYTYGSKEAIGRITLSAGGAMKKYVNHRLITAARDRNDIHAGATFFYHILPKTSLLFEARRSQYNYKLDSAGLNLDSVENRFFGGFEWDITAITTGSVRAGLLQKDFDNAAHDSFSGFSWEVGAVWSPLTYSQFTFQTVSKTDESYGVGNFVDSKMATVGWQHSWNTQVSSSLNTMVVKNDYVSSPQEEGIVSVSGTISYEMRRWLTLSLKAGHSQRLSNRVNQDYKKNEISVAVLATL